MKQLLETWFQALPSFPGLMASGLRFADQAAQYRQGEGFTDRSALENAWRSAADTFRVLKIRQLPSRRLRWQFSEAVMHAIRRDDDHLLLFLVRAQPAEVDAEAIEARVAEFLSFQPPEG